MTPSSVTQPDSEWSSSAQRVATLKSDAQQELLKAVFAETQHPDEHTRMLLVKETGLSRDKVIEWFRNMRASKSRRQKLKEAGALQALQQPLTTPKKRSATEAKTDEDTKGVNLLTQLEEVTTNLVNSGMTVDSIVNHVRNTIKPTVAETMLDEMSVGEVVSTKSHLYTKQMDGTFLGTPNDISSPILRDVDGAFIASQLVKGDTITTRGRGGKALLKQWMKLNDNPTSPFTTSLHSTD